MAIASPGPSPVKSLVDFARDNTLPPAQLTDKTWVRPMTISGSKWNSVFPYQLIVVERLGDGTYAPKREPGWTFTLPFPPESMTVSMPFAISTDVTLGGIIEEHNGAPLRMIHLSGSTGVFFGRAAAPPPKIPKFSETIFAGTVAASEATRSASREFQTGTKSFDTNLTDPAQFEQGGEMEKMTGYYQLRLLEAFFEAYVELKKTSAGRNSRLAFAIWKQEQVYLCTPMSFDAPRDANRPLEYLYSINLKGWKRVTLNTGVANSIEPYIPVQRDPGKLARLLSKVEAARAVLQGARKTILAIGGDIQHSLFDPMRELTLFAKDALGVPLSVADLADSLIQEMKAAVIDLAQTGNAVINLPNNVAQRFTQVSANAREIDLNIGSLAAEQNGDPEQKLSREAHPANSPFVNPTDNYDFFKLVQVGDLHLQPSAVARIAAERDRVRRLTRLEFQAKRDAIEQSATAFANAIGVGNDSYNEIYGIEPPTATALDKPTDEDYNVLFAMNQLVMEMNRLVVTGGATEPDAKLDSIATVAGMASRSGIAFRIPKSKYAVPFPYGSTLEMVATRYLGDANRWHEIAALNGLRTPYVDEEGFELSFLVNGSGNQLFVVDASLLFVGQPVWLGSTAAPRSKRRITKIDRITATQYVVSVDGAANLGQYTTLAHAKLFAFLPNTVNSQQTIYIPSDTEPQEGDFKTAAIPGIDAFDPLLSVGGIDFLLDSSLNLVVTENGDTRWATGLTNIIQTVKIALSVRRGTLNQHPNFGLPIAVGDSIADLDAVDVARATQQMFAGDPTFAGVNAARVTITGPVARLSMGVEIAGTKQVIPVSADVAR